MICIIWYGWNNKMYYESEQEINKVLQELNIDILEIDDIYMPTDEDINCIYELYDIFE